MNPIVAGYIESVTTWLQLIVLIASVITLAVTLGKTVQKPNQTQNDRLDALEAWQKIVNSRLDNGDAHFGISDKGNHITQEAILALMSHAINGNDVEKLRKAKEKLENYLIEK